MSETADIAEVVGVMVYPQPDSARDPYASVAPVTYGRGRGWELDHMGLTVLDADDCTVAQWLVGSFSRVEYVYPEETP